MDQNDDTTQEKPPVKFEDVLANLPPNKKYDIEKLFEVSKTLISPGVVSTDRPAQYRFNATVLFPPKIVLYCDNDECKGDRFFECSDDKCTYQKLGWDDHLLYYTCRNCESNQKSDAIRVGLENKNGNGYVIKLGEIPPYGPFTPSRLIKFVGKDRELFLTGRRAESQGMGIGSFSYYRRVVENQKDRIFDEIIRVMQKIGAPEKQIEDFKTLKNEFQFKKAVDSIKVTLLDTLLIKPIKDFPKVYLSLNNSFRKDLQALAQFAPKPEPPDLSDYIKEVYGKNDKK